MPAIFKAFLEQKLQDPFIDSFSIGILLIKKQWKFKPHILVIWSLIISWILAKSDNHLYAILHVHLFFWKLYDKNILTFILYLIDHLW